MTELAALQARLQELHPRTAETPLFNPVFQLSLELSRRIESGDLPLSEVSNLVAELECEGLLARAARLEQLVAPLDVAENRARIAALADAPDFAAFAAKVRQPLLHVVFTAHPTFLLTRRQSEAVAGAATCGTIDAGTACVAPHARDAITLDSEHADAMAAMARAQIARDTINRQLLSDARRKWPSEWRGLDPLPLRFASWVGYDMDGRTDISWATSLRYRLAEKTERLASYAAMLEHVAPEISARLRAASDFAALQSQRLAALDLTDPAALSEAANALTKDHPHKLTSLSAVIGELEAEAAQTDDHAAEELLVAAAAMRADGLGMG